MSTWSGIDEFCAVARVRSFSQAARRLGLSTPQVSREVARLEDRLGQRLLYRSTRRVSLTEVGERFFDQCRRLVEDRDELLAAAAREPLQLQGHLHLTCTERFIVPMLNEFMRHHPQLSVQVLLRNDAVDLIEQGIDLAVRCGPMNDSRLVAVRVGTRTRYLCASPAYLQAHGAPATLEELRQHECVCGADESWSFVREGRPYEHRPHGRFLCNSGHALIDTTLEGFGICQLPDFYVEESLRSGALLEILPQHRPEDEDVWAIYPHRRHVPLKVKLAVQHLKEEFLRRRKAAR
jgi:DNA-binding transcriptional LysR family regulator